ncbi:MAG TPA: bifunctional lysylphosphatidylglycerol flippase/synthetase MprF [Steroidobacteraceae bacterium]|nr:bifunctional lysylphosphatidylglycerol flippase/synthetase MprF [Steroidobacteraceae bacterium]
MSAASAGSGRRWPRWLGAAASLVIFSIVLSVLHGTLEKYHLRDILQHLRETPSQSLWLALAFTAASYLMLVGYDFLGLKYVGHEVSLRRTATTSFMAFAVGHNVGFATLTGAAIRIRMYGAAGASATQVVMISSMGMLTTALGAVALIAFALLAEAQEAALVLHVSTPTAHALGIALTLALLAYFAWVSLRRPIAFRNWSFTLPSLPLTLGQVVVAAVDLCFAAAALYVLLPETAPIPYAAFLAVYVLAIFAVLISNVPGGIGVLESLVLLAMPRVPADQLLAALLAYRAVYYLLPLAVAVVLLAVHEAWLHAHRIKAVAGVARDWLSAVAPQTLGAAVFVAGGVLLVSGATQSIGARVDVISRFAPLPVIELSHLLGSIAGLGLVILSRALFRRVQLAWQLAVVLLLAGAVFSLLKGFDYEEALIALAVALLLYAGRDAFYRQANLLSSRFTPQWLSGLTITVAAVVWIGLLAHRHVEYSHELWWTFAFSADAPRMLRASLVVSVLAAAFGLLNWLSPAKPGPSTHDAVAMEQVKPIVAQAERASANLALLDDKRLLLHPDGNAFLMYQISGRSWIAMADPVGPQRQALELAWTFRELSDQHDGWTVFYQVTPECLPLYVDLGLALLKLGEEARVPLGDFGLDGSRRADLRTVRRKAEREGASFEVLPASAVPALMDELRAISDEWLATKATSEKRFSVGYFSPQYLANFPVGLVRVGGRIVAFTNIWASGNREELSIDLMRQSAAAPRYVMDYLFIELMLWGKAEGYRWFNLGMAPLSGLEQHPLAPAWHRMGNLVFDLGEHFYNFEGLRRYKEKFYPVWEPRYLATPGGLALPRVLVDVTSLIAGGLKEIVSK